MSAFRSGIVPRAGIALALSLAATAAAVAIERRGPAVVSVAAPAPVELRIDSSFAVARWHVRVGGQALDAERSDAHAWSGRFAAGALARVAIRTEPVDGASVALRALRVRIDGREHACLGDAALDSVIAVRR